MKLTVFSAAILPLVNLASAALTPTLTTGRVFTKLPPFQNASVSQVASLGYATLNGGTSGGSKGDVTTTVSTLAQFTAAVRENMTAPAIVVVKGIINGTANVRIASNKTIIGLPGSGFDGVGLYFRKQTNLILRNIISANVTAAYGDGLTIENSTNVWVDHCEFYSAQTSDKDRYDGLIDIVHGSDYVTVSNTYFHDHWKASLIGHSDSNGAQDTGRLHVTYAKNYWHSCNSRGPSIRFGTAHIFNSYYVNMSSAINTRMGAQVLAESNAFRDVRSPITSVDSKEVGYVFILRYAIALDNDLGGRRDAAPAGNLTAASVAAHYNYTLLGPAAVAVRVPGETGAILKF